MIELASRKELDSLGYPIGRMIQYAKWRYDFRKNEKDTLNDIQSEYDVPLHVAQDTFNIACPKVKA